HIPAQGAVRQRRRAPVAGRVRQRTAAARDPRQCPHRPQRRGAARAQRPVHLGRATQQHRASGSDPDRTNCRRHHGRRGGIDRRRSWRHQRSLQAAAQRDGELHATRGGRLQGCDMNISEPFIRRPIATTLLMAAVAFVGIAAFPFLPVAPLPQVDFPTIQVTATWQGASAETMATSVAQPLERQFAQIPGVPHLTPRSALGPPPIVTQSELNRNIDPAGQDVQAAITVASKTLPQSMPAPPSYKKVNPADSPILLLALRSDTMPLTTVDEYADLFLAQQISQVSGVAQVSIFGDRTPAIRIQVDPAKLASSGITLEEIRSTLVSSTTNVAKGTLSTPTTSFTIATNDQIVEAGPFNDVILAYRNGAPIRVRDVGRAVADQVD